ncbi:hypothetical protein CARUB_v10008209mg [Capsella rubella]|uniref:Importin N-terminal domain-containing protein n=1 Tax=Capsella rubella TaxID=81985 RepID=R0IAZ1_9BRAS|nr:exportin-2 [Capsella rubella]EOA39589.1 hypothetical protein CARUB_v10008209mg [Capsella rubella]
MEWNQETLQRLAQCFLDTLSLDQESRQAAEKLLSDGANQPNYSLAVLRIVAEPSVNEQIRHVASVNFKNHLRSRWLPPSDHSCMISPMEDSEKEQIKTLIVSLMLSCSSPCIQNQLSEALIIIGKHDFPNSWPSLLPQLVVSLGKAASVNDYVSINGILGIANSIFKKFRYQYLTNDLFLELEDCVGKFASPLQVLFLKTAELIDAEGSNEMILKPLFESQKLCCRIFFSLSFQDLPEVFEKDISGWMKKFQKYLSSSYYSALESTEDGLRLVDDLRAAVCEIINLFMEKYEEEFGDFRDGFASAIWKLLRDVSKSLRRDKLATKAIKFLTIISKSVHHTFFASHNLIKEICHNIVIPNVYLRDEDEELFDINYIEFIRRDMEGSDVDTRRRIACELLKELAVNYKIQVTQVVTMEIQSLLSSFSTNPVLRWKDKDCAIFLVVSLATKKTGGGASMSTDLIDVQLFFEHIISPELQSRDVNSSPMLKAGSLKFLTMFRSHIPKFDGINKLFPELVRFLTAESNVVHSYAAICIEKFLLVKEEGGVVRYGAGDISPFLSQLMKNLFEALKFQDSEENQYLMKCIMRVLGVADISLEVASDCIGSLKSILSEVCKNPKNPVFNHYLFESVAVLVRRACERNVSLVPEFERALLPSLQMILDNDVSEFLPYAFQLLTQLVELSRPLQLSENYMRIFSVLLEPNSWERKGNVPALVPLLKAFLQRVSHEVWMSQVLDIFKNLVSSPSTDEQGFYVLNTVVENIGYSVIEPHMKTIWDVLFRRLERKYTVKFQKSLVISMSLFLVKHGPCLLLKSMNTARENVFTAVLEQIWIPNVKLITGTIEVKLTAVAATRLICESPALLDPSASKLWGKMLDSIITLVSRPELEIVIIDDPEMTDEVFENVEYKAVFVNLYNAGRKEEDPLKETKDPKEFLLASLFKLSSASPGRYGQIIGENVEQANQEALLQLCNAYNCGIA